MFKDTEEELERLEQALLEEEAQPAPPDPMEQTMVFRSYNADRTELDPEELSQAVLEQPRSRSLAGIALFMIIMTLIVVGLVAWWLLRGKGGLP